MINESDNTATKMVLDRLGIGYVQQQFPRMGLLYTGIYEEGMSIKGGRVMHENYTTAREMTSLMDKIYTGQAVDKVSSEVMLDILKKPKAVASRLAKGMPAGWEIAHKTGLLRQACHDSAVFLTPHGDYAITVLTGQNRSYSMAKGFHHQGRQGDLQALRWAPVLREGSRAPQGEGGAIIRACITSVRPACGPGGRTA